MGKRKPADEIRLGQHYMRINGKLVQIDPFQTNLPERCKLAIAELRTGRPHVLVEPGREVNAK